MIHKGLLICWKNTSGLGGEEGNHPRVNDIDQFGKHLGTEGRTKWLMENLGLDRQEAQGAADILNRYSEDMYDEIHDGSNVGANNVIDNIIHNPQAPVFTGEQFRGLHITQENVEQFSGMSMTPREYLDRIMATGIWKEPGASSFSSKESVARDFGHFESPFKHHDEVSVLLYYKGGKSGMPIKHMSSIPGENEVLHSGRQMRDGMKIVSYRWMDGQYGPELHVALDDKKRK